MTATTTRGSKPIMQVWLPIWLVARLARHGEIASVIAMLIAEYEMRLQK